jgi:diguanylate cyclase (GGDEF)-like protein
MSGAVQDPARLRALERSGLLDPGREAVFDRLTALARDLLDAPVSLVSLVTDERQFFKSDAGLEEPLRSERETPLSHSFCKHVVDSGAPLVVEDTRRHELLKDNPAIEEHDAIAYAGIPVHAPQGPVLGSFCVIDHEPRVWEERDVRLLSVLAEFVMKEMALQEANQAARRALDREERQRHVLELIADDAPIAEVLARLTGMVEAETGMTASVDELAPDAGVSPDALDRLAAEAEMWSLPVLSADGDPLGVVWLDGEPDPAEEEDVLGVLESAARLAAVAIERGRAREALAEAALHDDLTGLPNRRLLADRMSRALARQLRTGETMALIFLDLDGFKAVNDTYGHEAGDEVLLETAQRLAAALRPSDTVARYGGDEFVVVCEDVQSQSDANDILERLIGALDEPIELLSGQRVQLGASAGLVRGHVGQRPEDLLSAADRAMYEVKQARRQTAG